MNRIKNNRIPWLLLSAVLLPLLFTGCGKEEVKDEAPIVRPVKVAVVGGFRSGEFTFPGRVEADEKLIMSFRVAGRLLELPIKEGQEVSKGQLIARLEPADYQILVDEAAAENIKAQADYRRYQDLYTKDAVPVADLDLYRSRRDVARARLEEAEKNLRYTYLRAPFSGMIGRRYIENFMDVQTQQDIVDLNNISRIELKINVAENIIAPIKRRGKSIKLEFFAEFEAAKGKRYELKLKEIASRADPGTQTFEVTLSMPQPEDLNLLPGMTGTVHVKMELRDDAEIAIPITVPAIAVLGAPDGSQFVWVIDPESMKVRKVGVEVGEMTGDSDIKIKSGLEGGETVVISGLTQLEEGTPVRKWEDQEGDK